MTTAQGGNEAIVRLAESVPDLIISDIMMPGMSGYEFVNILRSNPRTDLIPIIFLTAKDRREDRIIGFRSGVDAYISKPFDPEELLVIIANILNRASRISSELDRLIGTTKEERISTRRADEDFTGSEWRVAILVSDGLSNKEIAAELSVSVRTVEGHISNILSKKAWGSRVEIARHVLKQSNE